MVSTEPPFEMHMPLINLDHLAGDKTISVLVSSTSEVTYEENAIRILEKCGFLFLGLHLQFWETTF